MERKLQQLYLMSSFRGQGVAEMVMSDIERKLGKDAFELVSDLDNFRGLGLVNFLFKPHWNRDGAKREKFSKFIKENPEEFYSIKQPIICLNDNQLVYVDDDKFQIWEA